MVKNILDKGVHKCEKCKREFEWNYFQLPRDENVHEIPTDLKLVHTYKHLSNNKVSIAVNCPHCDYDNLFEIDTNIE
ncbi:MAG: hypothetical protein PHT02_15115 [Tissierellia bacterium]|nr:hypothetical protein [Tissierellia bacterium]